MLLNQEELPKKKTLRWGYIVLGALILFGIIGGIGSVTFLNTPPTNFPVGESLVITSGTSVGAIVEQLKAAQVVRSELFLYLWLLSHYKPEAVKASTYTLSQPLTTIEVATLITTGDFTSNLVRITHREGERVSALAETIAGMLPNIHKDEFIATALPYEGKLFPETYFVPPHFTATDIINTMNKKYQEFIQTRQERIVASKLSEDEIIILASIIEREANDAESMRMVSGILQNRLHAGMPLQADASIEYILDKPLEKLTPEDLDIDSPYNTYLNRGLPPTPISNPGAVAIDAVLNPIPNDYYFYITGNDGNFYYAKTYEEHKRNIVRYLR